MIHNYNKDFIAQGSIALLACPMQVQLDVGRVNSRRTFFEWAGKVKPLPQTNHDTYLH